MTKVEDLLELLNLKSVDVNVFQGYNKTVGSPNVFGGQVLAQAINAASQTITNSRVLHSMHAYFLEAGNLELPIIYNVALVRDGGSFSVRRVTADQNGKTIFILSASFHKKEDGYNHQIDINTKVKQPEELMSWTDMLEQFGDAIPKKNKRIY
ncbi:acyl-CoA thioesterase [Gaetbulibacter sp. NE]|uniref:acyl-CoA thioesterase n=1 Tax=Gaetbulibacter sp. NE TaxID=2982307 RepID=UPI0021D145E5|nr:acyl-CoA thioesterase domain-containing protein [Gaetbulibacter sp. NE]